MDGPLFFFVFFSPSFPFFSFLFFLSRSTPRLIFCLLLGSPFATRSFRLHGKCEKDKVYKKSTKRERKEKDIVRKWGERNGEVEDYRRLPVSNVCKIRLTSLFRFGSTLANDTDILLRVTDVSFVLLSRMARYYSFHHFFLNFSTYNIEYDDISIRMINVRQ